MSDPTPTRQETVEANVEAVEARFGDGAWNQIFAQLLKDINISLAMLVDNGGGT